MRSSFLQGSIVGFLSREEGTAEFVLLFARHSAAKLKPFCKKQLVQFLEMRLRPS